jgi:hypothetical protein
VSSETMQAESSLRKLMRLAPSIRDHKDLETKLTSAPPHLREIIYEAVRPFLKFKAKPMDKYIVSAKQMAERERLPTMDEKGNLHEFQAVEVLVAKEVATKTLTLTCHVCHKTEQFFAFGRDTNVDVVMKARVRGWIYNYKAEKPHEICPECPTELRVVN